MMHSSQRSEPRRSKMCIYHQDIYRLVAEPQLRNKKATRRSTQTKKKEPTNHSELLLDRSDNGCHHGIRDKIMDCIISPPRQPTDIPKRQPTSKGNQQDFSVFLHSMNTFIDSQTFWSAAAPAKAADRGPGYRWEAEAICVHYQMALDGRLWSLDDVLATSFGFFFLFFFGHRWAESVKMLSATPC